MAMRIVVRSAFIGTSSLPTTGTIYPVTRLELIFARDYRLRVDIPDSNVHGANMGPIWSRQDPGGPHVGPGTLPSGIALELPGTKRTYICHKLP